MDLEKRIGLVEEVGEEIITDEDLRALLEKKKNPVAYDGFEPSGQVHIAQGLLRTINVNKMVKAGCRFKMLVADWHAWANNKFGGDLEKIQVAGEYMVEVWKASGMNLDKVDFVWANELVSDKDYWSKVMKIATTSTVKRIVRCSQIMGRKESEGLKASQILYPCMQTADIFHLGVDIAQLGMDQRKVNVLARELGQKLGYWKPVAVHHHMVMGLQQPKSNAEGKEREIELKMSKSIPDSAIFMTDSEKEVERKLNKAYCPEKQITENPVLEYCKHLVFKEFDEMKIERPGRFGGNIEYNSFEELAGAFESGALHPADLKKSTASYINEMIAPVRKHFEKGKAKKLLEQVQSFKVTR
tara:strand:+ start:7186 stop:8256 length:1071 start_codon:yes stop_codon:yes gene_type:complete